MPDTTINNDIDALRHLLQDLHHSRHSTALRRLLAERDALTRRVAELEAHLPAIDLRERLLESALQGSGCRLGIMDKSDAEELGRQAMWIVNGALDAMRKGVGECEH